MSEGEMLNVLLVEDDEGDTKAFRRAFKRTGVEGRIIHARNGIEALEAMRGSASSLPDRYVVLLDLNMPGMNGIEFLKEVRRDRTLRRSVIFVLTTSGDERDIAAAYDLSIAGYILKSSVGSNYNELMQALRSIWRINQFPEMPVQGRDLTCRN